MDIFRIKGGHSLYGEIEVEGAKNAALPIMMASLLSDEESVIDRVPYLKDISTTARILEELGCQVKALDKHSYSILPPQAVDPLIPYELVKTMRASVLVLGPLLARHRKAEVSLPGGCAIGARPIDLHLKGLEVMGAEVEVEEGYVKARCPGGLRGAEIRLEFPSVGATENLLMAAALAEGKSLIVGAAKEPEIKDLGKALVRMGAQIKGLGTDVIEIDGVSELSGLKHSVMGDRIEAGTYLMAGAITGGEVAVRGVESKHLEAPLEKLKEAGCEIQVSCDEIRCRCDLKKLRSVSIFTDPFPGFPTDMQAQWMALMTQAKGSSVIEERIFENRFMHVPEMNRLGSKISISGNKAHIEGPCPLSGAQVMSTDLRASAGLVLSALVANGESEIHRIYHLDRGYEALEDKLSQLGADIQRFSGPSPEGKKRL
jgi:UDP-N-acetylglucosamine 1-carboxyvinyltransferase